MDVSTPLGYHDHINADLRGADMAQTTEYQVTGMSCGHCEASVRGEVAKLAGVEHIDVSAATGRLVVESGAPLDGRRRDRRRRRGRLRGRARLMTTDSPSAGAADARIELLIGGMTCASCAARIEKKLNRLDGVAASVNYATEKAVVSAPVGARPPACSSTRSRRPATPRRCPARRARTTTTTTPRRPRADRAAPAAHRRRSCWRCR